MTNDYCDPTAVGVMSDYQNYSVMVGFDIDGASPETLVNVNEDILGRWR